MSLPVGKGYCDLNIPSDSNYKEVVKRALSLGYQTLAINVKVHQNQLLFKSRQNKKAKLENVPNQMLDFPKAPNLDLEPDDYPDLNSKGKSPSILKRLTITFFNNDFLPFLSNSENVKDYDLIAILPESTIALQNLLKSNSFKGDIICFNPEQVKDVLWNRKMYMELVRNDYFFEIPYAPCIRDNTLRRRIIAQAHTYHAVGKSKSIFISSDASNALEIRGPHDVSYLGFIFGLNEQQGKDAVKQNPTLVVQNAAGRKLGPYRALVQKAEDLGDHDKWKIPDEISSEDSE